MNITSGYTSSQATTIKFSWFINITEIVPGSSTIIGDNVLAFYSIHYTGFTLITISVLSSIIVILNIISKWKRNRSKLDFADRFPLYQALSECLWGLSHFWDHMYLVAVQKYPDSYTVQQLLSISAGVFFGYQQLMHTFVAAYTCLHVVYRRRIGLGKLEWKLHLVCFIFLSGVPIVFYLCESPGSWGYWMAYDSTTMTGQILGVLTAIYITLGAICTTCSYRSIKTAIIKSRQRLRRYASDSENYTGRGHTIALMRLTTFVCIASLLYCPLALLVWISCIFQFLGVVEPLTSFLTVVVANSSGWANAYGYFHNERINKERQQGSCVLNRTPTSVVSIISKSSATSSSQP